MPLARHPLIAPVFRRAAVLLAASALAACNTPSKEALEAARNTFACQLEGERLVIRFEPDEARLLMPGGQRVNLYRIPSASGVRYTNGLLELRGKGTDLQFIRHGTLVPLDDCQPYVPPPA